MSNNDFYIGWMPAAPGSFVKHIRKVIIVLFLLAIAVGVVVALLQKQFSTAVFEYGHLTRVKGIYLQHPVPSIKVIAQKDPFGRSTYLTMPLVGYGKFGAEGTISEIEKEKEKKRLLKMSKNKTLLPHKQYRVELNKLAKSIQQKNTNKEKPIHHREKTLLQYY